MPLFNIKNKNTTLMAHIHISNIRKIHQYLQHEVIFLFSFTEYGNKQTELLNAILVFVFMSSTILKSFANISS